MLRPDFAKWGQGLDDMRRLAIEAEHVRSRERFQALYMIGSGEKTATQWAAETQRQPRTVLGWIHLYNEQGAQSLHYRATGGATPLLPKRSVNRSLKPSGAVHR
jgi:hypothetical protein